MNLAEFKAWFEGFTEILEGPPSEKQWARIQEKVGQIKDAPPVTIKHFHDYYYRPWRRYYEGPYWSVTNAVSTNSVQGLSSGSICVSGGQATGAAPQLTADYLRQMRSEYDSHDEAVGAPFDSSSAFAELGRAEFRSLAK